MTPQDDPPVRLEILATAAAWAVNTVHAKRALGKIPRVDALVHLRKHGPPAHGWKLSTIRAWRPEVADRCAAILETLDRHPLAAAATRGQADSAEEGVE